MGNALDSDDTSSLPASAALACLADPWAVQSQCSETEEQGWIPIAIPHLLPILSFVDILAISIVARASLLLRNLATFTRSIWSVVVLVIS